MGALHTRPYPTEEITMKRWLVLVAASLPLPALAGAVCKGPSLAIPTVDEVGLIVLAVLVGGVASWVAKRRK